MWHRGRQAQFALLIGVAALLGGSAANAAARLQFDPNLPGLYVEYSSTRLTAAVTPNTIPGEPPTGRIRLALPSGYRLGPIVSAPTGTALGYASLEYMRVDAEGDTLFGSLSVGDAAALSADPTAQACDAATHAAAWRLEYKPSASEETQTLPIFVDAAGPEDAPGSAYEIVLCPPQRPDQVLLVAGLTLPTSAFVPPTAPGEYLWRAEVSPLGPTGIDSAHAYELQAHVPIPQTFTLSSAYDAKTHRAALSGRATELGRPISGARVYFLVHSAHVRYTYIGPAVTDASGRFSITRPISETTDFEASVEPDDPGACTVPADAPGGCLSGTRAVPAAVQVTVHVPLSTGAKHAFTRADQALAKKVGLSAADLPGWTAQRLGSADDETCAAYIPDEHGLVLTGTAIAPFVRGDPDDPDEFAASYVRIFATSAQAKVAFTREATLRIQLGCTIENLKQADNISITAAGTIPAPRVARATRGFRVAFTDTDDNKTYVFDSVVILGRRSLAVVYYGASAPMAVENQLVRLVGRRAARA